MSRSKKGPTMKKVPQSDVENPDALTDIQQAYFDFLVERIRADGLPPTVREYGAHFHVLPNTVQGHLKALTKKKKIRRLKGGRRGYVPVVGRVCPCCLRNVGRQKGRGGREAERWSADLLTGN